MSPSRSRLRRAAPRRSGPVRNPTAAGAAFGTAADDRGRSAARVVGIPGAAMLGAVECGVQTAYTVIDEYMRRGREAAGRYREHPNWRDNMNDNRYNYSNPYTAWGPMGPFIAPWMQAMQAWACAMSAFVPGGAPQGSWGQCATSPKVSVKVSSQYPTEVSACVDPGADAMRLTAELFRIGDETGAPSLKSIGIDCQCGHVSVSVTVPKDQPAGRYSGAIRDSAGCKHGELTVEISKHTPHPGGKTE